MHFHRLTPTDLRFKLAPKIAPRKAGPIAQSAIEGIDFSTFRDNRRQLYIFIEDNGRLWIGENDSDIRAIGDGWEAAMPEGAIFRPEDLSDAFRLGLAVAHLQHTERNQCPIAAQLLLELPETVQVDLNESD